ncbi:hypothetical protein [Amycolatopsis sp. NBC_01480]|uniref:hypothetical protein n=1 Tax=Amycolatopsis sp. NBC_01480 TaxID=2903562 RepID=UPI002E2DD17B|nr:hypothetical protein [Amycolatopsis sp. NBC_01480]
MTAARAGFSISVTEDDHQVAVRLAAPLDENGSSPVALCLTPFVLLTPGRPVVLGLTELTTLHDAGVETLAEWAELAAHRQCDLQFVTVDEDDLRPLPLAGSTSRRPRIAGARSGSGESGRR